MAHNLERRWKAMLDKPDGESMSVGCMSSKLKSFVFVVNKAKSGEKRKPTEPPADTLYVNSPLPVNRSLRRLGFYAPQSLRLANPVATAAFLTEIFPNLDLEACVEITARQTAAEDNDPLADMMDGDEMEHEGGATVWQAVIDALAARRGHGV